jgi:hypothetical protein
MSFDVPLFGCFSFRSPITGSIECIPHFLPKSVCGTCFALGTNHSLATEETPINCFPFSFFGMGPRGRNICLIAALLNLGLPCGATPLFCIFTGIQRRRIAKMRGLTDEKYPCCTGCLCMPCSLYQEYQFLKIDNHIKKIKAPTQMVMV